jgi:hypothetical protein
MNTIHQPPVNLSGSKARELPPLIDSFGPEIIFATNRSLTLDQILKAASQVTDRSQAQDFTRVYAGWLRETASNTAQSYIKAQKDLSCVRGKEKWFQLSSKKRSNTSIDIGRSSSKRLSTGSSDLRLHTLPPLTMDSFGPEIIFATNKSLTLDQILKAASQVTDRSQAQDFTRIYASWIRETAALHDWHAIAQKDLASVPGKQNWFKLN